MQITLNITHRAGPPDYIEIRGKTPGDAREHSFYLHHNLMDSEKVLPRRKVVFRSSRSGNILEVISVTDLATKRTIPLEPRQSPDAAKRFMDARVEFAASGDHEPALDEMVDEAPEKGAGSKARLVPSSDRSLVRPDHRRKDPGRCTSRITGNSCR